MRASGPPLYNAGGSTIESRYERARSAVPFLCRTDRKRCGFRLLEPPSRFAFHRTRHSVGWWRGGRRALPAAEQARPPIFGGRRSCATPSSMLHEHLELTLRDRCTCQRGVWSGGQLLPCHAHRSMHEPAELPSTPPAVRWGFLLPASWARPISLAVWPFVPHAPVRLRVPSLGERVQARCSGPWPSRLGRRGLLRVLM